MTVAFPNHIHMFYGHFGFVQVILPRGNISLVLCAGVVFERTIVHWLNLRLLRKQMHLKMLSAENRLLHVNADAND